MISKMFILNIYYYIDTLQQIISIFFAFAHYWAPKWVLRGWQVKNEEYSCFIVAKHLCILCINYYHALVLLYTITTVIIIIIIFIIVIIIIIITHNFYYYYCYICILLLYIPTTNKQTPATNLVVEGC